MQFRLAQAAQVEKAARRVLEKSRGQRSRWFRGHMKKSSFCESELFSPQDRQCSSGCDIHPRSTESGPCPRSATGGVSMIPHLMQFGDRLSWARKRWLANVPRNRETPGSGLCPKSARSDETRPHSRTSGSEFRISTNTITWSSHSSPARDA